MSSLTHQWYQRFARNLRDICQICDEERREVAQVDRGEDETIFDDDEGMESV